ncbi:hypothetical protein NP493_1366g01016 [Ridgeia piscesae]|uniref:Uncharacterized protein n=1 Tax=Ridgeia piscesae TaxID=27915 RepID=A0AAD9NCM8_RIDPI|nr:hypothetical protein NP493_1366g01016 [Ridgeia piscesae]
MDSVLRKTFVTLKHRTGPHAWTSPKELHKDFYNAVQKALGKPVLRTISRRLRLNIRLKTGSPAVTLKYKTYDQKPYSIDLVPAIELAGGPPEAGRVLRKSWIPEKHIDRLCSKFHVVAKIHPKLGNEPTNCRLWRLSFSAAEKAILLRADGEFADGHKTCRKAVLRLLKTDLLDFYAEPTQQDAPQAFTSNNSIELAGGPPEAGRVLRKSWIPEKHIDRLCSKFHVSWAMNRPTAASGACRSRPPRKLRADGEFADGHKTCRKAVLRLLKTDLLDFYAEPTQQDASQAFASYYLKMIMLNLYDRIPCNADWESDTMLLPRYCEALCYWKDILVHRNLPFYFEKGVNLMEELSNDDGAQSQMQDLLDHVSVFYTAILLVLFLCTLYFA